MSVTSMVIKCDICGGNVDKDEKTSGFGAMTIIKKEYGFGKKAVKKHGLEQKDYDICTNCCEKILELIKEIKKPNEN